MLAAAPLLALTTASAAAGPAGANLDCKLRFSLSCRSAILEHSQGRGVVTRENGQRMAVKISATGVGLTARKSRVDHGSGTFMPVRSIGEVLRSCARSEAPAGMVESDTARDCPRARCRSLRPARTGRCIDLGAVVGAFTVERE